ncbi:MAG: DUF4421 family protein [Bacteroidales bacterium]
MIRFHFIALLLTIHLIYISAQETKVDTLLANAVQIADDILYQDQDTNYIRSYANKLSLKLLASNKFNSFRIWEQSLDNSIRYRPDLGVNFGIGGAYQWFSMDIATNLGFREENISNSIYRDVQVRVLTSKHYCRLRYQYYYGYKMDQIWGLEINQLEENGIRTDTRTMQFGVQYLYVFNYGKFSLKAPFAMNERQKKSAGSFVAGIGFQMFTLDADSSLIPNELEVSGSSWINFSEFDVVSVTANFGYFHSFIIKERFFITLGVIPGMGISSGDYRAGNRIRMKPSFTLRAKTMNAIGYSGARFFAGIQLITGLYNIPLAKDLKCTLVEGRSALFIGYRF